VEEQSSTHEPGARVVAVTGTVLAVGVLAVRGDEDLDRFAEQLAAVIPKQGLRSPVDEHNPAAAFDHDHTVGYRV
jgi:hypothetical protein